MKQKEKKFPLCSGHVTTDNMLKDLDVALRASRNYIEAKHDEKISSKTGDGFNLERQVCYFLFISIIHIYMHVYCTYIILQAYLRKNG